MGIIAGVYYRFDKTIGVLLALLAFCLFVVRPAIRLVREVYSLKKEMHPRPVGIVVLFLVVVAIVAVLVAPLSSKSLYPCFTASADVQKITLPLFYISQRIVCSTRMPCA